MVIGNVTPATQPAGGAKLPAPRPAACNAVPGWHRAENPAICGPSGTGKSHFCEGLANADIDACMRVSWFSLETLTAALSRALGDALATAATYDDLPALLDIVQTVSCGSARQMVVEALWRFRKDERVAPVLCSVLGDPAVSLHAMSALRRTIGNEASLPYLVLLRDGHNDPLVRRQAGQAVRRAEKAPDR